MFLAQDCLHMDINLTDGSITFCILPFGTGNDTSQVLGWGKQPKSSWFSNLQSLAQSILYANEENFNIWEIETQLKTLSNDQIHGDI
jgi:diacylglycerol kinase family enzyme